MIIEKNILINLFESNKEKFIIYKNLIVSENEKYGLTSIDEKDFIDKHFYDSLTVLPLIENLVQQGYFTIADIGSGAGFPSIPVAIVKPELNISLIESNHKKSDFLIYAIKELNLANIKVYCKNVKEMKEKFDIIVFRAFAQLDHFFKVSKPIFKERTKILAMKGKLSEIINEISVVKKEKLWKYISDMEIHNVIGFPWERNILELTWEK